jgi:hypothetical protein
VTFFQKKQINEHKKKGGTSKEKELDKELALTSVSSPPPESSSLAEAHATGKDDWEKDPNMIDPVIASSVKEMSDIRTADDLRSDGSAMYVPSRSPGPSPLLKAQATRVSQDESQTSQNLNDRAIVSSVKQTSRSRTARVQPDGEASSSPSPPSGPSSHHTARTPGVSKDKLKKNMTLNDQVIGSRVKKMSRGRTSHEPQPAESTVHPSLTKAKATASSEDRLNNLNSNDEGIASHLEKPSGIETAHDLERKKGLVVKKNQISSIKSHLASEQEDQTARPKFSEEIISNNPQTQSNLNGSESNMTRKYGVNIEPDIKIAETIHQENNDKPFTKPQETYSSVRSGQNNQVHQNQRKTTTRSSNKGNQSASKFSQASQENNFSVGNEGKGKLLDASVKKKTEISQLINASPNSATNSLNPLIKMNVHHNFEEVHVPSISKEETSSGEITEEISKMNERNKGKMVDEKPEEIGDSSKSIFNSSAKSQTSEEERILTLIKERKYPERRRNVLTGKMRFKGDYDAQAKHLYNEYQKAKIKASEFQNSSGHVVSWMGKLKIEKDIKKQFETCFSNVQSGPRKLRRQKLRNYSASTVQKFHDMWGKENVLSWEAKDFDIMLMAQLALSLNLDHKEPHFGISPLYHNSDLYKRILDEKQNLKKIISSICKIVGEEEGIRRFGTLVENVNSHFTARTWKYFKQTWLDSNEISLSQARCFERYYGIYEDPKLHVGIPTPAGLYTKIRLKTSKIGSKAGLLLVCGKHNLEKKQELIDFSYNYLFLKQWWQSAGLESARIHFGIDIMRVLKIGEALQFGSPVYLEDTITGPSTEKAYDRLLDILKEPRNLPWIESPERDWFYNSCGSLYQDRLREISLIIFLRRIFSKEKGQVRNYTTSGCELLWIDLGLKIDEMPNFWEMEFPDPVPEKLLEKSDPQLKIDAYQKISGPFAEYERIAFCRWFQFFYLNKQMHLSKTEKFMKAIRYRLETDKNVVSSMPAILKIPWRLI